MKQESEYIKKIKRRMIIIGILVVSVFTTISFGFYYMGASQKGESGVSSIACFDMNFTDGDSINLTNAVSISDEMGLKTNPYHFELTNNCDTEVNYYVILNVKDNSFSDDFISVSLNGKNPRILSSKRENTQFDKPAGYSKSYILEKGTLTKGNPKEYDTRLWINSDATYEDVQGKSWEGQIKVVSTVKELEDEILAQGIPNELMKRVDDDKFWQHSGSIMSATFESTINPKENAAYTYDVSELQDGSVMSYLVPLAENNTIYDLYIQADGKIIANPDSSKFFSDFGLLGSVKGLSNLDTSNVTDMSYLFFNISYDGTWHDYFWRNSLIEIEGLEYIDTSNVINMAGMFACCEYLENLDVSNFDTRKVTDMSEMFNSCGSLTKLDLSNFDTSNVTDMSGMFNYCKSLTMLDVSNFDTSNVTNMSSMFSNNNGVTYDIGNLQEIKGLENFDTSNVINMSDMFAYSGLKTLNLSNFNTSNVTDMSSMFSYCRNLTILDVSSFDTSNVTSMYSMFRDCSSLAILNVSNFNTSKISSMHMMFKGCSNLTKLDLSNFDTSNVIGMDYMFQDCSTLTTIITIRGTKCTSYGGMFSAAATETGTQITVNYTSDASSLVDKMIATKSSNSNVVKGTQVA